ncbi:helix-turn-helix transcriptional regulator [Paenibacillus planticolens]|uniref:Helix-turn-helix domain-containing protein n=1 Tax=Paenibacillus planticolens TaxID=2654976 RepID=A0ABX1ZWD5_9BACL|nr:AraC family transcriptional regulator [Paenibacillus planticolens]NOV04359.1 helix-turn-helix domain-containing protein [Paenibacillus planticolens]
MNIVVADDGLELLKRLKENGTHVVSIIIGDDEDLPFFVIVPESKPNEKPITVALKYIDTNIRRRLTLTEVSKQANVSPTYLAALFKQKLGQTFLAYLISRKLEIACVLLQRGYQCQEVADYIGYDNPRYFGQTFKRYLGETPTEYRSRIVQ